MHAARMGMFDEIECAVPLPDGGPGPGTVFQTKSLPVRSLSRYQVTADGRLVDALGRDLEPDGVLVMYASGPSPAPLAAAPEGQVWWEYRLRFSAGRLANIDAVDPDLISDRRPGLASCRWYASDEGDGP